MIGNFKKSGTLRTLSWCPAFCMLLASAFPANANKVISTPSRGVAVVTDANLGARVCYYEDKAYSLGAVLNISGVLIECIEEKDFELNGSLKWKALELKSESK